MKELVKYFLGIVIIVTIIYTLYISYNVFKFVSSEDSTASIADYELKISLIDEEINELESMFNEEQLRDNSNSIVMNYDGTPISWVVKLDKTDSYSLDEIENLLLENGFISFKKSNSLFIGPYIDKLQLEEAKTFLNDSLSLSTSEIKKWKI
jgi:uncharacterized membrane protein YhiD involved in acid resistance